MTAVEMEAWKLCARVQTQIVDEYAEYGDDHRTALYVERIQENLSVELEEARLYLSSTTSPSASVVHGYRRRIALYHEHVDLHSQGLRAFQHARFDRALVAMGRG